MTLDPSRKFAVLSDVNGNLEALRAVIDTLTAEGVTQYVFLGDSIGYGPNPKECLEFIRSSAAVYLLGRIEYWTLRDRSMPKFNHRFQRVMDWTLKELQPGMKLFGIQLTERSYDSLGWLGERPRRFKLDTAEGLLEFVHTNPISPEHKCILRQSVGYGLRPETLDSFDRFLFIGDNHQQFILADGECLDSVTSVNITNYKKVIVSVGSVGQPRDRIPGACFAIYDAGIVQLRRVGYDVEQTKAKILKNPAFDNSYAERLDLGI